MALLKQALFNHLLNREEEDEDEEVRKQSQTPGTHLRTSDGPSADPHSQRSHLQVPSGHSDTPEHNGEKVFRTCGCVA